MPTPKASKVPGVATLLCPVCSARVRPAHQRNLGQRPLRRSGRPELRPRSL